METPSTEALRTLAANQAGLVAGYQARDKGFSSRHWWRLKNSPAWVVLSPRVLALRGSPETDTQRALAAVLDAGREAMLHGPSALAWLGVGGYVLQEVHVARPYGHSSAAVTLGRLHRLRSIRPYDRIVVRGVPTESALRAIWAEAAAYASGTNEERVALGVAKIGRLLDRAHRAGVVDWTALHTSVNDELRLCKRGRAGTVIMRELAMQRLPGDSVTESRNEEQFEQVMADAGVPPMQRQTVVGDGRPLGRADFRDPVYPLVVEVNSRTFHSTPTDREADRQRYRSFNEAGFAVCVVWEDDLWQHPTHVAETVRRARVEAGAGTFKVMHSASCPWPPAPDQPVL